MKFTSLKTRKHYLSTLYFTATNVVGIEINIVA